jgi:hypothetical protein
VEASSADFFDAECCMCAQHAARDDFGLVKHEAPDTSARAQVVFARAFLESKSVRARSSCAPAKSTGTRAETSTPRGIVDTRARNIITLACSVYMRAWRLYTCPCNVIMPA